MVTLLAVCLRTNQMEPTANRKWVGDLELDWARERARAQEIDFPSPHARAE